MNDLIVLIQISLYKNLKIMVSLLKMASHFTHIASFVGKFSLLKL